MLRNVMAVALVLLIGGAAPEALRANVPPRDDRAAIDALLQGSADAWNAGDLEGYAKPYSDAETSVFSSGAGVEHGARTVTINANKQYFAPGHHGEAGHLSYTPIDFRLVDDSHALVFVRFELASAGPDHLTMRGISSLLLSKDAAGGWQIETQHDSTQIVDLLTS